jgi:hypothetical protein
MARPQPSDLSAEQVLQGAFDDAIGSLRVVADLSSDIETVPNKFSITDHSVHLGVNSVKILDANLNRSFLFIQNTSRNPIWLDFNQHASAGFPSMQLNAGAILIMESNSITIDSIYAIANTTNVPLVVKEG